MRAARVAAGALAVAISAALAIVVLVRDVGLNPLNGWTIVLGAVGGVVSAVGFPVTGAIVMLLGAVPAMVGGLGVLYVIPVALLAWDARRPRGRAAVR